MFINDIAGPGDMPLLEKTLAFTEARNRVLAENIANITTPGYRAKQLDAASFQAALREAAQRRDEAGGPFHLEETAEFRTDESGRLHVTPSREPVENLLFQDGTNVRLERQMALLAENTMLNQVAAELLRGQFNRIESAIRGRMA